MAKAKSKKITLEEALVPVEEQPYEVPENWCWTYLGAVSDIIMGQSPSGDSTTDDASYIPLIGGAADMGELFPETSRYTMKPTKTSYNGDLILSIRATLGRPIFADGEYCLGRGVAAIRSKYISKEFLRYYCIHNEHYLYDNATGTTFAQVTGKVLQSMQLPLPPLLEQKRIVEQIESLFSKLDEAKEKIECLLESRKARWNSVLNKAFTGNLTARWREDNHIELESWEYINFEKIIVEGPQNGMYKPKTAYGNGTKILRIDCFYDGKLEPWEKLKRLEVTDEEKGVYLLSVNDIVVNRVNSMPYLGKSALICELPEECVFESNMMRIKINIKKANPEYVIRYLNSFIGLQELRKNAKQAVNQASINQQDVKAVEIALPSLDEQNEIVKIITSISNKDDAILDKAEMIIEEIELMKKSVLAKAFRGELGTNIATEESAIELLKSIL